MTLVASVSPFGCPLMPADILISGQPDPQAKLVLPAIGSLYLVDDSIVDISQVAWLAQKLCVITDNLVVGWAGCYESAKRILSSMRAYCWSDQVKLDDVQQCLATTNYDDQARVSLVCVFSHDKGFGDFGLNAPRISLPGFNQCRIIGNGKDSFKNMAQNIGRMHVQSSEAKNADPPSWLKAVMVTLASGTILIGEEINNYGGLQNGFGGLFEVLVFQDGKFAKLDDVLYCFWVVLEHSKDRFTLAPHTVFVQVKYHGDILLVRRLDFKDQQQMINDMFIIGPMAKSMTEAKCDGIQTPDLNSIHDCHYIAVQNSDAYEVLAIINLFARGVMVRFEKRDDGTVSFAVNGELLKNMHDRLVEQFYGSG